MIYFMSTYKERKWSDRHPLCNCPRSPTFPWMISAQPTCRGGKIAHPAQLTRSDIKLYINYLKDKRHAN